ncbi:MAG: class F sortase [Acidimicrobiia bacterium]|nr:class F sortase [Acidimicrobiia bacterium]
MRNSVALIIIGFLIGVIALVTWSLTHPRETVGDVTAFEQALTFSSQSRSRTTTTTTIPDAEDHADAATTLTDIPGFTIDVHPQGHNRIPVGLRIPALDKVASVIPAGVEPNGDMEVPANVDDVAWYKYGSAPGEPGSAVLAAHVDLAGQGPGVFFGLRDLEPGSTIYVDFDDGTTGVYEAKARKTYQKEDLPSDAIFSREGPSVLTLITCGGDFNRSLRRYDSNVVVYAVEARTGSTPFYDDATLPAGSAPDGA